MSFFAFDTKGTAALGKALLKNHELKKLHFKQCHLDTKGGIRLSRAVVWAPRLEVLSFYNCPLEDKSVILLAKALSSEVFTSDPDRQFKLWVGFCRVTNVGAIALASMLEKSPSMHSLGIRGNLMDTVGFKAVCGSLMRRDRLTYFSARFLKNVDVNGAKVLADVIRHSQYLREVELTRDGYLSGKGKLSVKEIPELLGAIAVRGDITFGIRNN